MMRTTTARPKRVGAAVVCAALPGGLCLSCGASAQSNGPRIASKLERSGVLDSYFPEVVLDVASHLAQAAPDRWRGVQVNEAYRDGWLNIYVVDARRLPESGLLDDE